MDCLLDHGPRGSAGHNLQRGPIRDCIEFAAPCASKRRRVESCHGGLLGTSEPPFALDVIPPMQRSGTDFENWMEGGALLPPQCRNPRAQVVLNAFPESSSAVNTARPMAWQGMGSG